MAGLGRRTHYRKHLTDSVLWDTPEPRPDECIAKIVNTRGGNQFDVLLPISQYNNNNNNNNVTQRPAPQLALLPTKFHKLVWVKRNDFVIVQIGMESTEERKDTVKEGDRDNAGIITDKNINDSLVDIQQEQHQIQGKEASSATSTAPIERDTNCTPLSLSPPPETISAGTNGTNVDNSNSDPSLGNGVRYMISHILYKDQIKHLKSKGLWPEDDPEFSDLTTTATATTISTATTKTNGLDDGIVYNTNHYYNDNDDNNIDDNGNREEQESEIDYDNDYYYGDDDNDDHNNETDDYNSKDDMLLFVNTNRLARVEIQDSSTDSEDEDSS
ncbi:translation initiation factor 1A / IF-1 [Nitzschia inconspicua]|uniref:Translation initiation factor 1A / IF-1 n=1 Tax=Nitzschia inconspicua TaxID=303405 RepID=A0A9K3K9A9_9STRA|nr:translation initiation factor 1A / IF-1 [Nitzschia inconspicua]KAG7371532.1 translation initiation factor 1A / IF-1 [Nitzschia inconspicua]